MRNFHEFQQAVYSNFNDLAAKGDLFCVAVDKDELWQHYLKSFPKGSNPVVRERTEHDCSCCRQFVRTVGNVVRITPKGNLVSIWDFDLEDAAYEEVANAMDDFVTSHPVADYFLHYQQRVGTAKNHALENDVVKTYEHFFIEIPKKNEGRPLLWDKRDIDSKLGELRTTREVFDRALRELTVDSMETVLEIIDQDSLYRGNQYRHAVDGILKHAKAYEKFPSAYKDNYSWLHAATLPESVARVRNTGIGTLLIDLSEGVDLEGAVRKFEKSIMAPENYKRPTALVSQKMVDAAKAEVEKLGLTEALGRRHAQIEDVSVNDVLYVDRGARKKMKGGAFDDLPTKSASTPKHLDKVETIGIKDFLENVVPGATRIEVLVENRLTSNLVSLIAPSQEGSGRLFAWDNGFSWAYAGDFTDSVKERVKRAGGNVTGELCCRLAWYNTDDLDFHMLERCNMGRRDYEISYLNARELSPSRGTLDVDMNAHSTTRTPVENIVYPRIVSMRDGEYRLFVENFNKRETVDFGFEVEVDLQGKTKRMVYEKQMRQKDIVEVAVFKVRGGEVVKAEYLLDTEETSKKVWGVDTQKFHRVSAITYSPNFWGESASGNRHYFFMVEGCVNDGQPRGFFNEYLRPDLNKHRKVLELVGSRSKVETVDNQLSGLGFSDTRRETLTVKVEGKFTRTLKVAF